MNQRRSVYADKLAEFSDVALGDDLVPQHRGNWQSHFLHRIGSAFSRRIILEIGCFDAAYLCRIAQKFPDTALIGLDWKCKAIYDGAHRITEAKLRNVTLLRARAHDINQIFAPEEVDEAWVFHPDPCDNEIALKNRLIAEPFLRSVHSILKRNSILALKTDHPGYHQWVLSLFGMPEPDSFSVSGSRENGTPKLKVKELMNRADLPAINESVRLLFAASCHSESFWQDPSAMQHTAHRLFAGQQTLFESRFTRKRLPIYYFEMLKKPSN